MMVTIGITRNVQRVIQTKVVIQFPGSPSTTQPCVITMKTSTRNQCKKFLRKQNKKNIQNITPDKSNDNNDDDAGDDDNDNNKSIGVGY